MDEPSEKTVKRCGSMKDIRENNDIRQNWLESVEPTVATISNRFRRLKLHDQNIEVIDAFTDNDIDLIKRHARELFPSLDLSKVFNKTSLHSNFAKKFSKTTDHMQVQVG